ncbi:DUF3993 domain-containing protein [Litchfieldia alkalitelluris]|uniref:DUF3993 domain-containing protein n=1 Tax=Litchfieldia alkalitelluris TaxID=304268 RepID=UPI00099743DE|nr:DUF3993 domain-containing protein [Litchfieldia alkalitelluris]
MSKLINSIIILHLVLLLGFGGLVNAANDREMTREDTFKLLDNAFNAQLSLSEKLRNLEEINRILNSYFIKDYTELFLKENLFEEKDGYIVYGSDFAPYYIPYFSYTPETKIIHDAQKDKYYVYEHFDESSEGPVNYEDHYATVTLQYTNDTWKISELTIDQSLNSEILELEKQENATEVKTAEMARKSEHTITNKVFRLFSSSGYSILEMEYPNQHYMNMMVYLY